MPRPAIVPPAPAVPRNAKARDIAIRNSLACDPNARSAADTTPARAASSSSPAHPAPTDRTSAHDMPRHDTSAAPEPPTYSFTYDPPGPVSTKTSAPPARHTFGDEIFL